MIPTRPTLFALLLTAAAAVPSVALAQQKPAAEKPAAPKPAPPKPAAQKPAPSPVAQATLLGQFADWGAYTASPGGRKVCFAISKPTSSQDNPPNRRTANNQVYLFVSTRPAEKVVNEVSLLVTNYALKGDGTLTLGGGDYPLQTQNDGGWVKNAADEAKLVDAMRKGSDLTVKAATSRGTQTTDVFSLKGISQALDRVAQECK